MNRPPLQSPRVTIIGWGKLAVEGLGRGKDFKTWPGGGRVWDWRETGTGHSPGIQVSDVAELLDHGCEVIVLTRGVFSRLKVPEDTLNHLEEHGIKAIVADTNRGVSLYNTYVDGNFKVGGLFHSTC